MEPIRIGKNKEDDGMTPTKCYEAVKALNDAGKKYVVFGCQVSSYFNNM